MFVIRDADTDTYWSQCNHKPGYWWRERTALVAKYATRYAAESALATLLKNYGRGRSLVVQDA